LCEGSGVHAERSGCGGRFLRWARESIVTFEEMTWGRRVGRTVFLLYRYGGDQKRKHTPGAKGR
jgi:hypothetical protein